MTDQHDTERPPAPHSDVQFVGDAESLGALFDALAAAQGEFQELTKDSTAEVKNKEGKFLYNFAYCPLDVVIAATRPALVKHGLALLQLPNGNELLTVLAHGKARVESRCHLSGWDTPQQFGGVLTYFKRYAMLSLLAVFPAGEDDDANAAQGNQATVVQRPRATPPEPKAPPPTNANVAVETKKTIGDLAKRLGWANKDLEGFSVDHGCGKLLELNTAKAEALIKLLESAIASNPEGK